MPIRVLLANHHPIVRSGLRLLLERDPEFRVVAEAANGREAAVFSEFKHPDIALLEVMLPHVNGIAIARQISSRADCPKTMFVTEHTDESYVIEAFKAGARGYVAMDSAPGDLPRAIRVVSSGRLFLSSTICADILDGRIDNAGMSDYEKHLCCLSWAGYEEDEIAMQLGTDVGQIRSDYRSINNTYHWHFLPHAIAESIGPQPKDA